MRKLGARRVLLRRKRIEGNYAFIDSQNLNIGIQKAGWKLDWRKFRIYLEQNYNVKKAFLFIGYMQENESLYEQMNELGYTVVLKPTVEPYKEIGSAENTTQDEKRQVKGNIDADLVLFAMKEVDNYQKAVIVSGDGDFYSLCEYLQKNNKLHSILTPNWQYSTLLKDFENNIVRLDTLRANLQYRHKKHRRK